MDYIDPRTRTKIPALKPQIYHKSHGLLLILTIISLYMIKIIPKECGNWCRKASPNIAPACNIQVQQNVDN